MNCRRPPAVAGSGAAACHAGGVPGGGRHVGARVVTPDGRRVSRNAAGESAATGRRVDSSRGGRTGNPQNLREWLLGAGPRAADHCPRGTAAVGVDDSDGSALADALCPARWRGNTGPLASAASAAPPVDRRGCNSAPEDGRQRTSAHSPSGDNGGSRMVACRAGKEILDGDGGGRDSEEGPREVVTPKGSSLGEKLLLLPEAFCVLSEAGGRDTHPQHPGYHRQDRGAPRLGREEPSPRAGPRGLARSTARIWPHAKALLTDRRRTRDLPG